MVLIQVLLPLTGAGGATGRSARALADTRRELADTFDGLTAYLRSPAEGLWTAPDGARERDDVVMIEVVTKTFDAPWWRTYARVLAERFTQDTIHVRALTVRTLDDDDRDDDDR